MSIYLKLMYDQWCDGQSNAGTRYKVFITMAAKSLHRKEDEVEAYLITQKWFKYSKEDVL